MRIFQDKLKKDLSLQQIKLIAIDLDGTLVPRHQSLRPRVINAVHKLNAKGIPLILATGRLFYSALPYAQKLGLDSLIITHHGALIKSLSSGEVIYRRGVELPLAKEVIRFAKNINLPAAAYFDDNVIMDKLNPDYPAYEWLVRLGVTEVDDLNTFISSEPTRIGIATEQGKSKELTKLLRDYFKDRLYITSGHPYLAEISHRDVSKGNALKIVANIYGLSRFDIMAIGDDWNDIEMLEYAGISVAMRDAAPEVLTVADFIAPTAEEDGAAQVLEEFLINLS